jgi:signal transduction histidine kinase
LIARAAVGIEEEVEQGVRIPIGGGFAGRIAAERRPVVLDDVDHAHVLNPILREKGIKSLLGVPLLIGTEPLGVLHVGTLTHRRFTRNDVELLRLVADRVAIAIERGQLHEQTLALDQLKTNFIAIASHELRTPATSVYGVLATLAARGDDLSPELRNELIRMGAEQGERLKRLLDELLDLSRMESHGIKVDPKPMVLDAALRAIVPASVPPEVTVEIDVPPTLAVVADHLVLDRIVSNLLINAARYGAEPITLTAESHDSHFRIVVEDNGAGVPEDVRSQLFERFARSESAPLGSGLGLAIARTYAHAHGGDLVYDPQDRGARFVLILPQG